MRCRMAKRICTKWTVEVMKLQFAWLREWAVYIPRLAVNQSNQCVTRQQFVAVRPFECSWRCFKSDTQIQFSVNIDWYFLHNQKIPKKCTIEIDRLTVEIVCSRASFWRSLSSWNSWLLVTQCCGHSARGNPVLNRDLSGEYIAKKTLQRSIRGWNQIIKILLNLYFMQLLPASFFPLQEF